MAGINSLPWCAMVDTTTSFKQMSSGWCMAMILINVLAMSGVMSVLWQQSVSAVAAAVMAQKCLHGT